jgi:ATP-dependent Clp protease ATP-binding subunit ClpA
LQAAGLTYKGALSAVIKIIGHGSDKIGAEVPLTPSACQIMAHSQEEAERMGQAEIQPEHICLALLAGHPEGVAIKVLKNFGVDTKALRTRIVQQLPVRKP